MQRNYETLSLERLLSALRKGITELNFLVRSLSLGNLR